MKKIKKILILLLILLAGIGNTTKAEELPPEPTPEPITINLTLRSGATIFFEDLVELLPAGNMELNGHTLDADSVLATLNKADQIDDSWNISDLQYFDSFGSFLLNCISSSVGNDCYDWHYAVDGFTPAEGMDKNILAGGENVYLYFSPQNRISLSASSINTEETLTATVEKYNFEEDAWDAETDATVGVTQPDPANPYNPPTEIFTSPVDGDGQATFSSIPEGSYDVGLRDDYGYYFPTSPLTVTLAPAPETSSGSHSGSSNSNKNTDTLILNKKATFDLKKAFEFLIAQQKENGSFGEDLYTDWAALALASGNYQPQVLKLVKYLGDSKDSGSLVTDFERRAMALMSLGLNPHNTNGENYIEKIISSFDGKQFGDINEDNDDIFALIVLANVGYTGEDKIITDDISFVLGKQRENGSWDESVDMTGAGIQALASFPLIPGIGESLDKAKEFLKKNQKENGGWNDNASSTSWTLGGINALNEKIEDWKKGENTPLDYLATLQDTDGGIKNEIMSNKIWETTYVISALSQKSWNQTMQKFEKREASAPIKIVKKVAKIKKLETPAISNTAIIINANNEDTLPIQEENDQKSWFMILLGNVFNLF